ncbi:hypothetical protein N7466_008866 [Penicillium verhagenii]|uniref:uncharacterized protein n=1 Tax=Penicillium verhagenii TaxID=1562060 RepID=UPI002544DC5A|nr:uncharacterized protein N7466_008866 [Penicillium verhagenii]KAJ5924679.1 hypothetical protein N7466_008866 [Penicillium verhagenii]
MDSYAGLYEKGQEKAIQLLPAAGGPIDNAASGLSGIAFEAVSSNPSDVPKPTSPETEHPTPVPSPPTQANKDRDMLLETRPIARVGYNKSGKEIDVTMNTYPIEKYPTRNVYQYEVNVVSKLETTKPGIEQDRRVLRRSFNCDTRKNSLPDAIYDGARTAWSSIYLPEGVHERFKYTGGLTRAAGTKTDLYGKEVVLTMLPRRKINLTVISEWLQKKHPLDEFVIEALNFLDHLIRDWPTREFTAHKRAYFFQNLEETQSHRDIAHEFHYSLGGYSGATCYRGIFQMIRPCVNGLLLNLDTAHAVFFSRISLLGTMKGICQVNSDNELTKILRPKIDARNARHASPAFTKLSKMLKGLRVQPDYEGCPFKDKSFIIQGLIDGGAAEYNLKITDKATNKIRSLTVQEYFLEKYNMTLEQPFLALIQMSKKGVIYPAELLVIKNLQRWPFKLNDQQTGDMIKYTAKKPAQRLEHIKKCKNILSHENDPNLQHFGLRIGESMIKAKARLLPNPEIQFGGGSKLNPGTTAKWDLRGKKFYKTKKTPLSSWGIGYFTGNRNEINYNQVQDWLAQFTRIYKQHGGLITQNPFSLPMKSDIGEAMRELYTRTKDAWKAEPQLLIIIVPSKDAFVYLRIKKSADCRFGVPSQVLQSQRCIDNRPQYHSNVLMKVNAKLGGVTNRVLPTSSGSTLKPNSIIIGGDVTHPALGVWTPSLAAMCISNDVSGISYMGGCQCNGDKVEIITDDNVISILGPLLRNWIRTVGNNAAPKQIYYFRDGVSESEVSGVLNKEVPAIRAVLATACNMSHWPGKLCVVIANKRHHLRAFPSPTDRKAADRNGNPLPGTLIDREVTSPHGWDFLLYAHAALQGTARPVHYKVVLDEIGHKPEELENMIYEQSYQYVRSTTPVSIHPAIYYSHLITARARHHEDVASSAGPQSGPKIPHDRSNYKPETLPTKLLPMKGGDLQYSMWWV